MKMWQLFPKICCISSLNFVTFSLKTYRYAQPGVSTLPFWRYFAVKRISKQLQEYRIGECLHNMAVLSKEPSNPHQNTRNSQFFVGLTNKNAAFWGGYWQYRLLSTMPGLFLRWRSRIPKNTEAEYILDILHVLGSGSLLTDRESQRAISRSAS